MHSLKNAVGGHVSDAIYGGKRSRVYAGRRTAIPEAGKQRSIKLITLLDAGVK